MGAVPPAPFVVGVSRSGTTLLRLMLDAHPELAIPPETHFLPHLLKLQGSGDELRRRFITTITTAPRWPDLQLPLDELQSRVRELDPFSVDEAIRIVYEMYAERFAKPRWGDKTPQYAGCMPAIDRAFGEAHFIHIIRDGRDVAVSGRHLWFGPGADPRKQAREWVRIIRQARRDSRRVRHYLEIRYEDLVQEPEKTLHVVSDFIDLPFSDAMLEYHVGADERLQELGDVDKGGGEVIPGARRRGLHQKAVRPVDPGRIRRWRREMSRGELQAFEEIAGDLLHDLGYMNDLAFDPSGQVTER